MKKYLVTLMDNSVFEVSATGFRGAAIQIQIIRIRDYNDMEVFSVKVIDDTNLY